MKILSLNFGSSSIKLKLFDESSGYQVVLKGVAERIGQEYSTITLVRDGNKEEKQLPLPDHRVAMQAMHQALVQNKIDAVGHRVVHGGERLRKPTLINGEVIREIKHAALFAPLHSQPNVIGIETAQELLPGIPQAAIFDTAAHEAMEPKAYLYGLPQHYYEQYRLRKYGFHGINHQYVAQEAAKIVKKPLEQLKVITCHLGNGCSISAFDQGKSVDNTMGLTPLEGLVMGSRCGDLDPAVVLYLIDQLGMNTSQVNDLLNKKSGLLGLCGKNDMRDIIYMAKNGDHRAKIAIELFVYRVQKYIGAFIAVLHGVDLIVFTGGIGENSDYIRKCIADLFQYLDAFVDDSKNQKNETVISSDGSKVKLLCIPANEELVIAQETRKLL